MIGMDENTGRPLTGTAHIRQSIKRIIHTQIGRRVQRREFGSDLFKLVSMPGNEATRLRMVSVVAAAIIKWEPRVKISYVRFAVDSGGRALISVLCSYGDAVFETSTSLDGAA